MQAADLLIAPTWSPKESLAVVEAMAAGLPVLVCEADTGRCDRRSDRVRRHAAGPDGAGQRDHAGVSSSDAGGRLRGRSPAAHAGTEIPAAMAAAHLQLFRNLSRPQARSV